MKRGGNGLSHMLTLFLVFLLLIPIMSSTVGMSYQSSVEDSDEISDQLYEDTMHALDSDSAENTTYGASVSQDVDIMIPYTSAARNWSSRNDGGIQNTIDEAIGNANTAMENSEIDLDINLAHSCEVNYTETGDDFSTDLQRLERDYDGHMEEVHDLRDYHGADLVSLFVRRDEDSDVAGVARGPHHEHQLTSDYAFSVVSVQDISSSYVFTHEIGHNFGAGHAKDQDQNPGPQLFDYSAGWSWSGDKIVGEYVSVMTYREYLEQERVLHFSNPDVYHEGDPTGDSEDGDNARTIRETKGIISNYQEPTPQINITYPSTGVELYQGSEQKIEWKTISGDNSVSHVDLYYSPDNGSSWETIEEGVPDTGTYSWEVPLEVSSSALIYAEATDEAGFSRNDVIQFDIKEDDVPPEIELIEPSEGEIFQEDELMISWEGRDDLSGISHYEITSDAHDWEEWLVTEQTQYTFSYLEDGDHKIGVRAVDNADNEDATTVNVTVDTTAPDLEIETPADGEVIEPGDVTVEWYGFDEITGISHFEIRINDNGWLTIDESTDYTFEGLDEGDYIVEIKAVDEAGNTAVEEVEFEVESESIFDIFGGGLCWVIFFLAAVLLISILVAISRGSKKGRPPPTYQRSSVECGRCGAVLPGDVTSCPNCGVEFRQDVFQCKDCGEWVDADLNRCPGCGTMFGGRSSDRSRSRDMTAETSSSSIAPTSGKAVETSMSRQPPPPPPEKENPCPDCGAELRYIDQYKRWYCDSCQEYK